MATINLDGDETILYGPGFQTTVLSPGLGATDRGILLITDPTEGDMLVYEDGVFTNHTLTEVIDEAIGLTELDDRFVNLDGDTMTGDLTLSNAGPITTWNNTAAGSDAKRWQLVVANTRAYLRTMTDALVAAQEFFTMNRSGSAVTSIVLNDDGADMDVRIEGDTATQLFVANAGLDAVSVGTTVAGAIADFAPSQITFNGLGANRDFLMAGVTATNLLAVDASADAVLVGTTTAGAIADFRSTAVVVNELGADMDVRIEGDTATQLLKVDAGLDAVQIGTTSAGDIADFRSGSIVLNESGADRDTRIEGDADANLLYLDAGNDRVGIGTATPTAKFDVNSDVLRLRTAKTPASAAATGTQGDIAWDASYVYVCVATDTWKRAAIATW